MPIIVLIVHLAIQIEFKSAVMGQRGKTLIARRCFSLNQTLTANIKSWRHYQYNILRQENKHFLLRCVSKLIKRARKAELAPTPPATTGMIVR